MPDLKTLWKYRGPIWRHRRAIWKYRKLWTHRKQIVMLAGAGAGFFIARKVM